MSNRATICLVMIVKTEAHILPRLFESVKPWIDAWSIVDTGSADDTKTVIETALSDVPGQLLEEPFVDFANNRTSAVLHAQKMGCDYLLLLDADHVLDVPDPAAFDDLDADSYLIELLDHELRYRMPYLVRSDKPWRYRGATHEFLACDEPFISKVHPTLSILHHGDGGTRPEKFDRDLALLERSYKEDPTNERTVFYLAQTYEGTGRKDDAVRLYRERAAIGGWNEEAYIALLRVGRLTDTLEDCLKAHLFRPQRPEGIYEVAKRFNRCGAHALTVQICEKWSGVPSSDILFVEREPEEFGILFEKAIAMYYIGRKDESKMIFQHLLTLNVPDHYRSQLEANLRFF